ncbi:MAG: lipase family protein [Terriglobia bacterium]
MKSTASSLECRLLCAATCAYDITPAGTFSLVSPHFPAVGWKSAPSTYFAGPNNINACLIGINQEDGIILAFRGTLPPGDLNLWPQVHDWMQDFLAEPVAEPRILPDGMKVHKGFWNALDSLWPLVLQALQSLSAYDGRTKLYITGHSKGGAMAALVAARLFFQENIEAAGVYLYGAPRAGNSAFVAGFPSSVPVIRYEHHLDIVPLVPPDIEFGEWFAKVPALVNLFGNLKGWDYTSLGTLRYIQKDGTVVGENRTLNFARRTEILAEAILGHWVKIVRAHGPWCPGTLSDGGYMRGVCPAGLCAQAAPPG